MAAFWDTPQAGTLTNGYTEERVDRYVDGNIGRVGMGEVDGYIK